MFNRFIYRREWVFAIYRETLSRFSCAASACSRHPCTIQTSCWSRRWMRWC
ncbi:hypothetical protein ABLN67_10000 [Mycobacterium tuberculosis]